jgi:hypothetical protein
LLNDTLPADEWALYEPIIDEVKTMIELGNKKNANGTYKAMFEKNGIEHTSVDWNGEDGALNVDLREDLKLSDIGLKRKVDCVTNIGTTEHCSPQGLVWHNILRWLKVGGYFVSVTPKPEQWWWHGEFYPTAEWYQSFCDLNGLEVITLHVDLVHPRENNYLLAKKVKAVTTVRLPDDDLMFKNVMRRR